VLLCVCVCVVCCSLCVCVVVVGLAYTGSFTVVARAVGGLDQGKGIVNISIL
jgi:hypothetical protein